MNALALLCIVLLALYGLGVTFGNVLYDLRGIRLRRATAPKKLPRLTVIIFVHAGHDPLPLVAQLRNERYRHLRIILVARHHSPAIMRTLRRYRVNCTFLPMNRSLTATLLPAIRPLRGAVLTLDTTMRIPTNFLRPSVRLLRHTVDCVRFANIQQPDTRLATLLHDYLDSLAQHWHKATTIAQLAPSPPLAGTLYTKRALQAELKQTTVPPRIHFAATIPLTRMSQRHTITARSAWHALRSTSLRQAARPSWSVTPLFVLSLISVILFSSITAFFFYLAFWLQQPQLLGGLIVLITTLLVIVIWSNSALTWTKKFRLILLLPAGIPLFLASLMPLSILCAYGVVLFFGAYMYICVDDSVRFATRRAIPRAAPKTSYEEPA